MTLRRNNFEGQTDANAVTIANSANSGDPFTAVNPNTGSITYTSARAIVGTRAIRFVPGSGQACFVRDVNYSSTSMAMSFCFYYSGVPTAALAIAQAFTSVGSAGNVQVTSAGRLQITNAAGSNVATSTAALISGRWYRVEMQITSDASAGTMALQYYLDNTGSAVQSMSGSALNTRGGNILEPRFGVPIASQSGSYSTLDMDALQVQDGTTTPIGAWPNNLPPIANAGSAQSSIEPFSTVTLTGLASSDPDGTISAYQWTQTGGPSVALSSATSAVTTFKAPASPTSSTLTFSLVVTDDKGATSPAATTTVAVLPHTMFMVGSSGMKPIELVPISSSLYPPA